MLRIIYLLALAFYLFVIPVAHSMQDEVHQLINEMTYIGICKQSKAYFEQIRDAAESNETAASFIARHTLEPNCHLKGQMPDAKSVFLKAYENNNPYALYIVGQYYQYGDDLLRSIDKKVEKNYQKALEHFRKAADQGWLEAQVTYAGVYTGKTLFWPKADDDGVILTKDFEKGLRLLKKYAEEGNALAQNQLGVYYLRGLPYKGYAPDYEKAFQLISKAAGKYDMAKFELASFYARGYRLDRDYDKALNIVLGLDANTYHNESGVDKEEISNWKSMLDCHADAETKLFGMKLKCVNRDDFRVAIKSFEVLSTREDNKFFADIYNPSDLIEGAERLVVIYTHDNMFAEAIYHIDNAKKRSVIYDLTNKYGKPNDDFSWLEWITKDGFRIVLNAGYSGNEPIKLSYKHPLNYKYYEFITSLLKKHKEHEASIEKRLADEKADTARRAAF